MRPSIQSKSIYGEGTAVLADDEGGRTDILYVEEAKDGKYKLRQNERKGVDVLYSEYSEAELREPP